MKNKKPFTEQELIEKWIIDNDMCGHNPIWDTYNTYYNLRADQIVRLAKYLEKNRIKTK